MSQDFSVQGDGLGKEITFKTGEATPSAPSNESESYLRNCRIWGREGDEALFHGREGDVLVRLDGYTILPNEEYDKLTQSPTATR